MPSLPQQSETVGRREQNKLQTRNDLLAVAKKLFPKYDFDEVTIDQIVDLAGVSQKTFFNYFANKSQFLHEFLLDWLATTGLWSIGDAEVTDCRSAIIPSDAHKTLDWIVENRHIMKMAMRHTDFLDFIYKIDEDSSAFDQVLHDSIRQPRIKRVKQGQMIGVVRDDISATEICRLYDALRIDTVRRWLYLDDSDATPERLHSRFDEVVEILIQGLEKKRKAPRRGRFDSVKKV